MSFSRTYLGTELCVVGCTSSALLGIAQLFFKELVSIYNLSHALCELLLTHILGSLIFAKTQHVKWCFIVVSIYWAFHTGEGDHFPCVHWPFGALFCDLPVHILCQFFSLVVYLFQFDLFDSFFCSFLSVTQCSWVIAKAERIISAQTATNSNQITTALGERESLPLPSRRI